MFGDWCIYVDEKCVILACDNLYYVKQHPAIEALMQGADIGFPYPGAKEHYILDIDHRSEARKVVRILADVLPYPKLHKKQVSKKG